jgi:hypothetical protein
MGVSIDASIYDIPSAAVHMQEFLDKHAGHRRPEATMDPKDFIHSCILPLCLAIL